MDKHWLGKIPTECDLCSRPLHKVFYDAKVHTSDSRGSWALVCESCFPLYGSGLGTGLGQMYEVKTGRKVAG